jgi:hypothetical protein
MPRVELGGPLGVLLFGVVGIPDADLDESAVRAVESDGRLVGCRDADRVSTDMRLLIRSDLADVIGSSCRRRLLVGEVVVVDDLAVSVLDQVGVVLGGEPFLCGDVLGALGVVDVAESELSLRALPGRSGSRGVGEPA